MFDANRCSSLRVEWKVGAGNSEMRSAAPAIQHGGRANQGINCRWDARYVTMECDGNNLRLLLLVLSLATTSWWSKLRQIEWPAFQLCELVLLGLGEDFDGLL